MAMWDPEAAGNAAQYLRLDNMELLNIRSVPFEGKTSVWVPYSETGYTKGFKMDEKDGKIEVKRLVDDKVKMYKPDQVEPQNPPKYELLEDMSRLTYLSEASVVHNLKTRYERFLIYTYSGLFCVTINPYKWLPVYDKHVVLCYNKKRRDEMPPHVYSVSDNAYQDMLRNRENQSLLITGESGAGKTVNTKRVIQFFAVVCALADSGDVGPALQGGGSLEDQIVAANPAMEAFGNAKTIRNDNSSRFGKFIRIHFQTSGKLASGDIDTYLLEKSRVTFQLKAERCFHIFYQLNTGHKPALNEMCMISTDPYDYKFSSFGEITVKSIDDKDELDATDESFDILGFTNEEKDGIYKITASIMHSGNAKFKNKPREEQAEPDGNVGAEQLCTLLGLNTEEWQKAICSPRVKVGTEFVIKGQTCAQVNYSLQAITKGTYKRLFEWLVEVVNRALSTDLPRNNFIGILDIAGFEIFEFNSFEQLCINYTNERLQQFFNHHMFILEQEEYKREGIDWVFIDFGMDLQSTIDLIEKPLGIMSLLEEECIVPKATDMSYRDKLFHQHIGKSAALGKVKKQTKFEAHFEIYHYAGTVGYNVTDWLLKNKDPLNGSLIEIFKRSENIVFQKVWESYVGADDQKSGGKGGKRKKGGSFQTVSALHRESLLRLLTNLRSTQPHFVRCIIPNEQKNAGFMDNNLVLHQLRCNGVLEGIRICRKGFPSRVEYLEWKQRYSIFYPSAVPKSGFLDPKKVCEKILSNMPFDPEVYRFGLTKLFFKAGIIGSLEDMRDEKISEILTLLQSEFRYSISRKQFLKKKQEREGAVVIQANWRAYMGLKDWPWQKLLFKIKPLLNSSEKKAEYDELFTEYEAMRKELEIESTLRKKLEADFAKYIDLKKKLSDNLDGDKEALQDAKERFASLEGSTANLEQKVRDLEALNTSEEEINLDTEIEHDKLAKKCKGLRKKLIGMRDVFIRVIEKKTVVDQECKTKLQLLGDKNAFLSQLEKDTKANLAKTIEKLRLKVEDKKYETILLGEFKTKLDFQVEEMEQSFLVEGNARKDISRDTRKYESDMRLAREAIKDLEDDKKSFDVKFKGFEREYFQLNTRWEDEQSIIEQLKKKIIEIEKFTEKVTNDLEIEKNDKIEIEKAVTAIEFDRVILLEKLNAANGATDQQIEMNNKLETEMHEVERLLREKNTAQELRMLELRKKHADVMPDKTVQVNNLESLIQLLDNSKRTMKAKAGSLLNKMKDLEESNKKYETNHTFFTSEYNSISQQVTESDQAMIDLSANKVRMAVDIVSLIQILEEKNKIAMYLAKHNSDLNAVKDQYELQIKNDVLERGQIATQYKAAQDENDQVKSEYKEALNEKKVLIDLLAQSNQEATKWRRLCQNEGVESQRQADKIINDLQIDVRQSLDKKQNLDIVNTHLENEKISFQNQIEILNLESDTVHETLRVLKKKEPFFETILEENEEKLGSIQAEISKKKMETSSTCSEQKASVDNVAEISAEFKTAKTQTHIIKLQVNDLKFTFDESNKIKSKLERENKDNQRNRDESKTSYLKINGDLEIVKNKVKNLNDEFDQVKNDCENALKNREEKSEAERKILNKTFDDLQDKLQKATDFKTETMNAKKVLEVEISTAENKLEIMARSFSESSKKEKEMKKEIKDLTEIMNDSERSFIEIKTRSEMYDRRIAMLSAELAELREAVQQTNKIRKQKECESMDAMERVNHLQTEHTALSNQKRRIEQEHTAVMHDVEEVLDLKF